MEDIHIAKLLQNIWWFVGRKWIYVQMFYRYKILVSYTRTVIEFRDHLTELLCFSEKNETKSG